MNQVLGAPAWAGQVQQVRDLLAASRAHHLEHSGERGDDREGRVELVFEGRRQVPKVVVHSRLHGRMPQLTGLFRRHVFEDPAAALLVVDRWHREQVARVYCPSCRAAAGSGLCWCSTSDQ